MPFFYNKERLPLKKIAFPFPQTYKPASVTRWATGDHHLSGCYITATVWLPTLFVSGYTEANGPFALRKIAKRNIRGITAHKVYPPDMLPYHAVSSYLTFSPLSLLSKDGYFLWHFLPGQNQDRLLTGVLPYAGRTFLL